MRFAIRKASRARGTPGLSRFLIGYLLMLVSALLLIHVLQPDREGTRSFSRGVEKHAAPGEAASSVAAGPTVRFQVGLSASVHDRRGALRPAVDTLRL